VAKIYTSIGAVEEAIVRHYEMYGIRISFLSALEYLIGAGKTHTNHLDIPAFIDLMDDQKFAEFISGISVDVMQILKDASTREVIREENTIPEAKDIFFLKHIPYIYDALHTHNYFEINYMYSGSCIQYFENERRVLNEGDMCIIPPFAPHNIIAEPGALALAIVVRKSTFDKMFWRLLAQKDLLSTFFRYSLYEKESEANYLYLHTDNREGIKYLIQNIAIETNMNDAYANSCAVSLLTALFGKMLRGYGDTIEMYSEESAIRQKFDFSLLLQYIQHNFSTVTLSTLSSLFHYSETYLSRMIKSNMGRSFIEIITDIKMNHASEMLRNTSMKIHEISEFVGYDSVDHFSRTFKKAYGMPPLDYRRSSGTV
jgi:AraC-like DNA-binding protein/mannose-6-phosphate isomerase-like protein (cupin superfamily)